MQFLIEQDPARQKDRFTFIAHSELAAIRTLEFSGVRPTKLPESKELQLSMKHHALPAESPEGHQLIHVSLQVEAMAGEPLEQLVEVKVVFELDYSLSDGYQPPMAHVEAFAAGNAIFHCWPFFREFAQSATQRMGLTVPPLPMLALVEKPKIARVKVLPAKPTRKRG